MEEELKNEADPALEESLSVVSSLQPNREAAVKKNARSHLAGLTGQLGLSAGNSAFFSFY